MVKIYIDPGHGGNDPGAVGNGLREKDINLTIALRTRDILNAEFEGHDIRMSRTTDVAKSLSARTNEANRWNADYYLSIHVNAGGGTGFESFIYNGSYQNKAETNRLRNIIHDEVIKRVDFRDRGKKEANFHVLRETRMPAALTENGFIDHSSDAQKVRSDQFLTSLARGHAEGLARALNLSRKTSNGTVFYRVVAGSFRLRENAEQQQRILRQNGFDSFIHVFHDSHATYYRVIVGSFRNRANAEQRVDELSASGFDSFIAVYHA